MQLPMMLLMSISNAQFASAGYGSLCGLDALRVI
jgi:hypothetical protein